MFKNESPDTFQSDTLNNNNQILECVWERWVFSEHISLCLLALLTHNWVILKFHQTPSIHCQIPRFFFQSPRILVLQIPVIPKSYLWEMLVQLLIQEFAVLQVLLSWSRWETLKTKIVLLYINMCVYIEMWICAAYSLLDLNISC